MREQQCSAEFLTISIRSSLTARVGDTATCQMCLQLIDMRHTLARGRWTDASALRGFLRLPTLKCAFEGCGYGRSPLKTHVPTTSNQRVSSPWRTHGDSSALTSVRPWSGRLPAAPDPLSLLEVSFLTRILATEAMACIEVATASMLPSIRQRSPPKRRLRLTIINSRWSMMAGSAGAQQVP